MWLHICLQRGRPLPEVRCRIGLGENFWLAATYLVLNSDLLLNYGWSSLNHPSSCYISVSAATLGAVLFMVALWNRADHCIFVLWFLSIFFFFSSPNLSGRTLDVYHTWCGLSANLEFRSEMRCTWLAENTGHKKVAKNCYLGTIAQSCLAYLRN